VDIIADILRVAVRSTKKTHIMYGCNLSFKIEEVAIQLVFKLQRKDRASLKLIVI